MTIRTPLDNQIECWQDMVAKTKIMYAKALAYRQKMNNLSEDDIRRPLYEKMIVEILDAAQFISNSVTRMAGSGH